MDTIGFADGIMRGLRRRCPHCASPTLFAGYLSVRDRCPVCQAENGRHRVDDITSYFTILLVGHLLVAPSLMIPWFWSMPLWASLSILMSVMTLATLAALPFVKGGVVGALAAAADKRAA